MGPTPGSGGEVLETSDEFECPVGHHSSFNSYANTIRSPTVHSSVTLCRHSWCSLQTRDTGTHVLCHRCRRLVSIIPQQLVLLSHPFIHIVQCLYERTKRCVQTVVTEVQVVACNQIPVTVGQIYKKFCHLNSIYEYVWEYHTKTYRFQWEPIITTNNSFIEPSISFCCSLGLHSRNTWK